METKLNPGDRVAGVWLGGNSLQDERNLPALYFLKSLGLKIGRVGEVSDEVLIKEVEA